MDNPKLSLDHFGHLFEVFATYYLLLGTSEKFEDYFGISRIFKSWPSELDSFNEKEALVQNMQNDWENDHRHKGPSSLATIREHTRETEESAMQVVMAKNTLQKLGNVISRFAKDVDLHYCGENVDIASRFYRFMRPFYIYFGTLSLSLLVLEGTFEHWGLLDNLSTINFVSFVVFLVLFINVVRSNKQMFNPVTAFIASIIFFFTLLVLPPAVLNHIPHFRYPSLFGDEERRNNIEIIIVIFLVLLPIITHIVTMACIVRRHNLMKKLKGRLNVLLTSLPPAPPSSNSIPIAVVQSVQGTQFPSSTPNTSIHESHSGRNP